MSSEFDADFQRGTERLAAFSDAVIAIAITLLVLEIHVPQVEDQPGQGPLIDSLLRQWPSYMGYLITFLIIGILWTNLHNQFRYIVRTTHNFLILNVLLLLTIGLFPFFTALLADYILDPEKRWVAVQIYMGMAVLAAGLFNAVWEYAIRDNRLIHPALDAHLRYKITKRNRIGPLVMGLCFLLSFVSVEMSLGLFILIMLVYLLPIPGVKL